MFADVFLEGLLKKIFWGISTNKPLQVLVIKGYTARKKTSEKSNKHVHIFADF